MFFPLKSINFAGFDINTMLFVCQKCHIFLRISCSIIFIPAFVGFFYRCQLSRRFNFLSVSDTTSTLSSSINWFKFMKLHISVAVLHFLEFWDIHAGVDSDWQDWAYTSGDDKGNWKFEDWSGVARKEWFSIKHLDNINHFNQRWLNTNPVN